MMKSGHYLVVIRVIVPAVCRDVNFASTPAFPSTGRAQGLRPWGMTVSNGDPTARLNAVTRIQRTVASFAPTRSRCNRPHDARRMPLCPRGGSRAHSAAATV